MTVQNIESVTKLLQEQIDITEVEPSIVNFRYRPFLESYKETYGFKKTLKFRKGYDILLGIIVRFILKYGL